MDVGAAEARTRGIRGRARERERIGRLVDAADGPGAKVLVLTGQPGAGKSTLLDHAADVAATRGRRVLRVRGCEGEQGLDFAGVHQLLRPVLHGVDRLPTRQRDALRHAFGMDDGDRPQIPEPLVIRSGVLTLLSEAATERPLLVVVDDAQWLDVGSLDVLAFVARRLEGERMALLLAARDEAVPARFDRDFPHLPTGPLDRAEAGLLLDEQPHPPRGKARAQIIEQAAGNPLALIELARAFAKGPSLRRPGAIDAVPLTTRLERLFAANLPDLPPETRHALLLVAAAGAERFSDALHAVPGLDDPEVWRPAEEAGLVRVENGDVRLRHPLIRFAIHQAASFADRREAHLALAAVLAHDPDRRAWHLAAAAFGPDEEVADALAKSAERSRRRGGYAAAATALERAAELTPDAERRAGRLLAAAESAMFAGHPQWVGEIAARVGTLTHDPELLAEASLCAGWSLFVTLRHDDALGFLLPVAESMATAAPVLALDALGTAATPAYNSGDPFHLSELRRIGALIAPQPGRGDRLWAEAVSRPFTERDKALKRLTDVVGPLGDGPVPDATALGDLTMLGAAAWILDETDLSVRLLGRAMDHYRPVATAGANCTLTHALALALFDGGAWTAAGATAEEAFCLAAEAGAEYVAVGAPIIQATLRAVRGDHTGARELAAEAVRRVDLHKSRSLYVRHCRALGMAALAEGDHGTAYEHLRRVFTQDSPPVPVHHHASPYHLADLAAAAVRVGRADDARAVLRAVEDLLGAPRSSRLDAIVHRATALLSRPDDAESHFLAALADPAGARWPFERALAQLDFAEWLRRRRRAAEARPLLAAALEVFERLDARPWIERATAELRAAGVAVADSIASEAMAGLTPQELQIAQLAAEGMTNRDIGARLYLSPRTIGFHLHKIFPKLGITRRAQLRDALGL
ncbi:LuxR family transcriptional regulator [Streptomyces sp. FH025]|uniref:helix-turn-helix transcriptional regulator n=1 Tax=Streptomyces sp. FH025 TaxID=2815937 RepID=UPI001A9F1E39|nr:LuxR family transcriptional regulator [Streptomyces sp. FH025]MBO1413742.1 AAA family ATPase [Streptomyces sp. FH025]